MTNQPIDWKDYALDLERRLAAATAEVEKLKGESEELLIKNNRLADDADKAEFYLKQSRQELEAERRERGLKSIDRICDTCGGEKDSEGRCAMCLQSKLTAAAALLAECQKELADRWPRDTQDWYENLEAEHGRLKFQLSRLTAEVERLREVIRGVLDSATPHPIEHPNMFQAFAAARAAMSNPEKQQ